MRNLTTAIAIASVLLLTGCSAGSAPGAASPGTPATPSSVRPSPSQSTAPVSVEPSPLSGTEKEALRLAAQKYSDAYLTGDAKTAYAILSARCQNRISRSQFAATVNMAESMYGTALPFESFSAKISKDLARVTYTYSVKAINQTAEPWVKESGDWHEDDC